MRRGLGRHNRRSAGGLLASISLNFLTSTTLDPRITFARASSATYTNASGNLASAVNNVPRFDYSPTSIGTPMGFLVEGQATNLFLNSTIDGTSLSTQTITTTATATTISFYGTGTIVLSGTATATIIGTGAYPSRKTYTFTPTAGALVCAVTGTVQYAQAEAQSFASSFIPTAGATATRAADSALVTGANFAAWFNQSQGTLAAEFMPYFITAPYMVWGMNDGSGVNIHRILPYVGGLDGKTATASGTGEVLGAQPANNAVTKAAWAYSSGSFALATNGALMGTASNVFVMPTVSQAMIGTPGGSGGVSTFNGWIRAVSFYPTRLPNGQLQTLTK